MMNENLSQREKENICRRFDGPVLIGCILFLCVMARGLTGEVPLLPLPFSQWEIPGRVSAPDGVAQSPASSHPQRRQPHVLYSTTIDGKKLEICQFIPFSETVDINTANQALLMMLEGIGPRTAEALIAYRIEHGPFKHPSEIMRVRGIGQMTYLRIANLLTVETEIHHAQ